LVFGGGGGFCFFWFGFFGLFFCWGGGVGFGRGGCFFWVGGFFSVFVCCFFCVVGWGVFFLGSSFGCGFGCFSFFHPFPLPLFFFFGGGFGGGVGLWFFGWGFFFFFLCAGGFFWGLFFLVGCLVGGFFFVGGVFFGSHSPILSLFFLLFPFPPLNRGFKHSIPPEEDLPNDETFFPFAPFARIF